MGYIYYLRIITRDGDYYYIGQTGRTALQRWREHMRDLRAGEHANQRLQQLYRAGAVIVAGVIVALRPMSSARREEIERRAMEAMQRRGMRLLNVVGIDRDADNNGCGGIGIGEECEKPRANVSRGA